MLSSAHSVDQSPIIPRTGPQVNWKQALAAAFRDWPEFLDYLQLSPQQLNFSLAAQQQFKLIVPRHYAEQIRKGDPQDSLLRQVAPLSDELQQHAGFSHNPVADLESIEHPGLLHKYHGRVLLMVSGGCAIHCRYCFRRHFPYQEHQLDDDRMQQGLNYIAADPSITEVILSGGDPLLLSDKALQQLLEKLASIHHLKRIRIHSRIPLVLPERMTNKLADVLCSTRLRSVLVIHANHPNELSVFNQQRLLSFHQKDIVLLNQSVLLKGVNNKTRILAHLSEKLFDCHVMPYYLHTLDKVNGAAHFDLPSSTIAELYNDLRAQLPGYLLPKLVREVSGMPGKLPFTG